MIQPKPTKEQEEALKNVLEDECFAWGSGEKSLTEKINDFFIYTIWHKISSAGYEVKYFFQRIFRKSHLADMDNWECVYYIVKDALRRVKSFRASNRHGHPGSLNSMEEWDKILDEIILKLELWFKLFAGGDYESMCIEHGWEYPRAKKIENKSVDYLFEGKDGTGVQTDDLDYDIKNPDYTYRGRQVLYYNAKAFEELQKIADEGLQLFAKWLPGMWD